MGNTSSEQVDPSTKTVIPIQCTKKDLTYFIKIERDINFLKIQIKRIKQRILQLELEYTTEYKKYQNANQLNLPDKKQYYDTSDYLNTRINIVKEELQYYQGNLLQLNRYEKLIDKFNSEVDFLMEDIMFEVIDRYAANILCDVLEENQAKINTKTEVVPDGMLNNDAGTTTFV